MAAQTTSTPYEHLVLLDVHGEGNSVIVNRLVARAKGKWLLPLADDDLLTPGCLDTLLAHSEAADIVWTRPLVWGNSSPHLVEGEPPYIPSFALVRRKLWLELGGYDEGATREEDRGLWRRALAAGAVFHFVAEGPTWIYRFSFNSDGTLRNKSYNRGVAS